MTWSSPWLITIFAAIWLGTFLLAWRLLARLVAVSAARTYSWKNPRYWGLFVGYRLVIIAPYAAYLILGKNIPMKLSAVIIGWVTFGLILSLIRFLGPKYLAQALWWVYGLFYDGLLNFYPYRHLLNQTEKALDVRDGQVILDLGCGTGNLTGVLALKGSQVIGVDSSSTMLMRARRKLRAKIREKRIQLVRDNLLHYLETTPDNHFDRIAMVNVVYAVNDRGRLWKECLRVLKPNGRIVITTSDREGSNAIVQEHLAHDSRFKLLIPSLLIVGAIDFFISELSRSGLFSFETQDTFFREITLAGGFPRFISRTYGGSEKGVNILFEVSRS